MLLDKWVTLTLTFNLRQERHIFLQLLGVMCSTTSQFMEVVPCVGTREQKAASMNQYSHVQSHAIAHTWRVVFVQKQE